jgi:ribonuclease P protein component
MQSRTFSKEERLTSKKIIAELMDKGISVQEYPLKFIYLPTSLPSPFPIQVCVAVPKRKIPGSVGRNLIKRRIREAYRHHKHTLYSFFQAKETQLALMVLYTGKPDMPYSEIEPKMIAAMQKLQKQYENTQPLA